MSETELNPCPFCGGEATMNDRPYYQPGCKDVYCCSGLGLLFGTREEAIKAWNQRPSDRSGEWQPIETAPKDGTMVLMAGFWNDKSAAGVGAPAMTMASWSSVMSDGVSGYEWYAQWLTPLASITITWTHWRPLPDPPAPEERQTP